MLNWQKQCYTDSLGPLLLLLSQVSMSCFLIVELTLLCELITTVYISQCHMMGTMAIIKADLCTPILCC